MDSTVKRERLEVTASKLQSAAGVIQRLSEREGRGSDYLRAVRWIKDALRVLEEEEMEKSFIARI